MWIGKPFRAPSTTTNQQPSLSPKLIYKEQNGTMLTHIIKLFHLAQESRKLSDYPIERNSGSHGKPMTIQFHILQLYAPWTVQSPQVKQ